MEQRWVDQVQQVVPAAGTYRQALRALGTYLNLQGARYLCLEAQRGALSWRFAPRGDQTHPECGRSAIQDLLALNASYGRTMRGRRRRRFCQQPSLLTLGWHPLMPEGYDRVLGALGARLDGHDLRLIRLEEGEDHVQVWYGLGPEGINFREVVRRGQNTCTERYGRDQLAALQQAVHHLRGHTTQP